VIKITDEMKQRVDKAFEEKKYCVWATSSDDGFPDVSFRGSTFVFDDEHIAFWDRSLGQSTTNLETNPHVCMLFYDKENRLGWRFYGTATVLKDGDVLTAIRLPAEWSGARFYFEKVADRNTWDFPLVNIAAAMKVSGAAGSEKVDQIRIVAGAVQCVPRRLTVVEQVVQGQAKTAEMASLAGQSAVRGATPLNFNHFKIPLLQNLVTRAIRDA